MPLTGNNDRSREISMLMRRVEKPARYAGGEFGSLVRPDAALSVAISYPDLYEIGMSNAAIRILYSLLNGVPDVACERVFAPAPDFEAEMRAAGLPLFSLETGRPIASFDVVGFSVGYELTLTNLLAILDLGGVPMESASRGEGDPLVIAGGPATTNPVPLGPFVDCVFVGEAEGWAERVFGEMAAMKRRGAVRADLLELLRGEGPVWFPGKTTPVRRALWRGFSRARTKPIFPVPSMRVVQDHGVVEIMRGCPHACRFCHASILYRPCRHKGREAIHEEVRALVEEAGYRQISLTSLSSGDYKGIHGLVRELNALYAPLSVSFSLPSLHVDSLSLGLLKEISEVRKSGLTFAVETPREEWQRQVRKSVTLEKVVGLLREAKAQGWKGAKFYFMVGLPVEPSGDESASIVDFLQEVRSATGMMLNVNAASFIPKPHTPWERSAQLAEEPALEKITAIKKGLAGSGIKIGYHAPILSLLEGIVARGDERAGRLVLDAYKRGARLDAWEEHVKLDVWRQSIAEAGWDVLAETCRQRGEDEKLPWDSIRLGISQSEIADGDLPPEPAAAVPSASALEAMAAAPPVPAAARQWTRVLFRFSKDGPAAFISHLDLMAIFERALARARYSPRFTEGFNPKPRLEFASPLGLGIVSQDEIAGIDLYDFDGEQPFIERMNAALPSGLVVDRAAVIEQGTSKRRSLMSLYWGAEYSVKMASGETVVLRLPAVGPSIRKTLEAQGTWLQAQVLRTATFAAAPSGEPTDYFDALCRPSSSDLI